MQSRGMPLSARLAPKGPHRALLHLFLEAFPFGPWKPGCVDGTTSRVWCLAASPTSPLSWDLNSICGVPRCKAGTPKTSVEGLWARLGVMGLPGLLQPLGRGWGQAQSRAPRLTGLCSGLRWAWLGWWASHTAFSLQCLQGGCCAWSSLTHTWLGRPAGCGWLEVRLAFEVSMYSGQRRTAPTQRPLWAAQTIMCL